MSFLRILHTNDMHGKLTSDLADLLREHRDRHDAYFDSGDCIKAGNLAIPLRPESVWPVLAELQCTASVLGNRETHVLDSAFKAKLEGARHPILCGNLRRKDGSEFLPGTFEFEVGGHAIGVISSMVAMVTERMATKVASSFLWSNPVTTVKELAVAMRPRVDTLIALTHVGYRVDQEIASNADEIDIILGGHSHTVLESPVRHGRTWVAQGGSHCRFFGTYEWDGKALRGQLIPWDSVGTSGR